MRLQILKYHLLSIVLLAVSSFCYGQSVQDAYLNSDIQKRNIDKEKWRETIKDINYNQIEEKKEQEDYDEDFSNTPSSNNRSRSYPSSMGSSSFWAGFFKILFFIIVIVALALLASHFMGNGSFIGPANRRFAKSETKITIDNIEEHIYESDLDRFIREAVEQKNYALAIRLYYLAIIKELSLNRTIHWKKDKTNKDYLVEMRKTNMFKPFREATRIFERIWYGKEKLEEADYQTVKPKFEALVKAAQNNQIS